MHASKVGVGLVSAVATAGACFLIWRSRKAAKASTIPTATNKTPEQAKAESHTPAENVTSLSSERELLAVARLRWLVYVGELKRNNYAYVDNIRQILEDPLDHVDGCINLYIGQPAEAIPTNLCEGLTVPVSTEEEIMPIVGCVRVHVPSPAKYHELFSINDQRVWGEYASKPLAFAFFSRFMVHAKYRGRKYGFADQLYRASAREARLAGARFLLLNW